MKPGTLLRRGWTVSLTRSRPCRARVASAAFLAWILVPGPLPGLTATGRAEDAPTAGEGPVVVRFQQRPVVLEVIEPAAAPQGARLAVTIRGSGFSARSRISLGDGIRVDSTTLVNSEEIRLRITIDPEAAPGPRDVTHASPAAPARRPAAIPGGFRVLPREPRGVRVPPVTEERLGDAERILAESGLPVGGVTEEPSDAPAGLVLGQDPAAGAMVEPGTPVRLRVSMGPPQIPETPGRGDGGGRSWLLPLLSLIAALLVGGALALLGPRSSRRSTWRKSSRTAATAGEASPPPSGTEGAPPPPEGAGPPPASTPPAVPPSSERGVPGPTKAAPPTRGAGAAGAPPPGPSPGPAQDRPPVRFTAFHPKETAPDRWETLLVYIHVPDAEPDILSDSRARLEDRVEQYGKRGAEATSSIARGAEIRVQPELPGFRFNPPHVDVLWLEDWHCADFRMQAASAVPGFAPGTAVNGRVAFFVGPLLVGEVPIWSFIGPEPQAHAVTEPAKATASPYRRIFPSYSHKDADLVNALKAAYHAIGDEFMQDIDTLRSGQLWNPTLLRKIEEADVFQLFWSDEASHSEYVKQEYEHALARAIPNFVRPLYWKKPLENVPPELSAIHFHFLDPAQLR